MKLSTILETLAAARLPSVTSEQLRHLVGTAEGKAFADDLKWFAAGEAGRREQLAAVVNTLAPAVRRIVEQLGFQFDLSAIITAAKLDGSAGIDTIKAANVNPGNRARAVAYLQGAGLQVAARITAAAPAPTAPIEAPYYSFKIFGSGAALCVSEARTRSSNRHTIQIEGALALGAGRREFDWQNKIIVQLTVQEAYTALATVARTTSRSTSSSRTRTISCASSSAVVPRWRFRCGLWTRSKLSLYCTVRCSAMNRTCKSPTFGRLSHEWRL
jgi:hypothetical protein